MRSEQQVAAADGSLKHLLRLHDGEAIEAVALPGTTAPSACLSSQVGCAVACTFCASGLHGVVRNLHAHEFLEQVVLLRRARPLRRLVLMGAGEPTHNLGNLANALEVLRNEGEIGPRHVMVSTVGPAAAIQRLAELGRRFTLALSLHALDQELRAQLIPTQAHVAPLDLLQAADAYAARSGRAYQLEWVLLGGVNDSNAQARDLAAALRGRRVHVSLIRWNPVAELDQLQPSGVAQAEAFAARLHGAGVSCRLRLTVGGDSDAACGQLRRRAQLA